MVAAEVALALMLLVSAGLLIRSFARLDVGRPGLPHVERDCGPRRPADSRYPDPASKRQLFATSSSESKTCRGVERASAVSALPMSPLGVQFDLPFTIDGLETASPTERPRARYRAVVGDYFQTMGIELKRGRVFDGSMAARTGRRSRSSTSRSCKRYFSGVDPIGQLVKMPMAGDLHIVGVVADIKHDGLQGTAQAEVFVPYFQFPLTEMQIVIASTDGARRASSRRVKREMAALDPALPIVKVSKIEDLVSASIAQPRFNMTLLAVACAVRRAARRGRRLRRRDLLGRAAHGGDRRAHGARRRRRRDLPAGGGWCVEVVLVGVALGLAGAAVAGRSLQSLLFGVPSLDLVTYVISGLAIVAVGAVAALYRRCVPRASIRCKRYGQSKAIS